VRKVWSNVMLVLPNVTIEPSFARKEKLNHQMWQKVQSHVIFGTAQFEDGTIKCQKKYKYNRTWQMYHSVYFGTLNKIEKR